LFGDFKNMLSPIILNVSFDRPARHLLKILSLSGRYPECRILNPCFCNQKILLFKLIIVNSHAL
jgi:hypothetical protein